MNYVYNHQLIFALQKSDLPLYFQIAPGDCGECPGDEGTIRAIQDIGPQDIPPFHPNCGCSINILTLEEKEKI